MAKLISLQLVGGGVVEINDIDIVKVYSDTLGSAVKYLSSSDDGLTETSIVTATLANISAYTDVLINITMSDGSTQYININRIQSIYEDATSLKAVIYYDNQGASNERLLTNETIEAVAARMTTKAGDVSYEFDDVNATTNVIALASSEGDKTSIFTNGVVFNVIGTDWSNVFSCNGNSTYNSTLGVTYITTNEDIPTGAADSGIIIV